MVSTANERVILISYTQEYSDLQDISKVIILSGDIMVVARGNTIVFQKAGNTRRAKGPPRFILAHG